MPYLYHTDEDRRSMLEALGLQSEEELFDCIPEEYRTREPLPVGPGLSEYETVRYFEALGRLNKPAADAISFLGGGIYDHVIPSVVGHLASRSEFYTAYTPYQAEVSQGTLQVIFEFQTMISRLTGLPVANASMYDAATALAESALMAAKTTRRSRLLVAGNINPRYRQVLDTYITHQDLDVETVPLAADGSLDADALRSSLNKEVAALVLQTPNYFGVLESPWHYREALHQAGALLVTAVDPLSLSVFRPPGEYGADIAVGEGQILGNPLNFGGPLLGFMACAEKYIRSLPGRLVSETRDVDGRRAFTLTLQTREQHIRREKATSNICTNQGLLALRSTIYLAVLGETGFQELGKICNAKAHRLASMIDECTGYSLRYRGPFFREFVVRCPVDARAVVDNARASGIMAGIALEKYFGGEARNDLLIAVTEKRTEEDFGRLCDVLRKT